MDGFIAHFDNGESGAVDKSVVDEVKAYSELPIGMHIIANAIADYTTLLRVELDNVSISELSNAISELEQKNMRRKADLEGIKRNYQGKKMPVKVRQMVANLERNIAKDEELTQRLRVKKHDAIVRDFR